MQRKPFHEQLKHERMLLGLTQENLAEQVGTNLKTAQRWERGKSLPQPLYRRRLCELFGKTLEELGLLDGPQEVSEVDTHVQDTREDWDEAPRDGDVYGRDQEIAQLKQWIVQQECRVVALLGLGGIGKTTLAVHAAMQVKDDFEYVFWRSLQNAPLLSSILKQCIQFVSAQQRIDLPERIDEQLNVLLPYLQEHRCLLVLDNVESILRSGPRPGHYLEGYEDYGKLIQRLGEVTHRSCLLLTSREKPREVTQLERRGTRVRSLSLNGMPESAGQKMLHEQSLSGSDEQWAHLISLYSGNPLALKLVSESIQAIFDGDIASFLRKEAIVFGDINELLEQQFQRLSDRERELLYWLAIEREPVVLDTLHEDLIHTGLSGDVVDTLESLRRRFLIETRRAAHFTLQPVIMEYMTTNLVRRAYNEVIAHAAPDAWLHYALIKAQAKEYIRDSQVRLLLAPIAQSLQAEIGEENIERTLKDWLDMRRQTSSAQQRCYLAGNALNILNYLRRDLRTIDFSRVMVRQAYLQDVPLPGVNFSHAHFALTAFTNTFGNVQALAWSAQKKWLAVGTATGDIWIYEPLTGTPIFSFTAGHTDGVWSVAFSPDEDLLASSSDDHTIRLWDLTTGESLGTVTAYAHRVRSVAFSPDGQLLASGSDDGAVCLWDVHTRQCLTVIQAHSERIWSVAFSPNGEMLASGSIDATIRLWDMTTHACIGTLQGHSGWVWSVAFNTDGTLLASGSEDCSVRIWDMGTMQSTRVMEGHKLGVRSVMFNTEASMLASGSEDQTVRLWSVTSGKGLHTLQGHTQGVRSIAFQPGGNLLVSGGDDQALHLWDAATGYSLNTLHGYTRRVWSVVFSPNSQMLVSSGEDRYMRLWDLASGQHKVLQDRTHGVRAVAFSPGGSLLATGGEDQTVRIWSLATSRYVHTLRGHKKWLRAVAFSPDGRWLASGGEDHLVRLWDVHSGNGRTLPQGHTSWVRSVAFSPNGNVLASGSDDRSIRLWDLRADRSLHVLSDHSDHVRSIAFSPDGSLLASGSEDQSIRLWDVGTGQMRSLLEGHTGWIRAVVFSPTGDLLASSSDDHTIRLWNIATGECQAVIAGHSARIRSIAFSPDGRLLASGSDDGDIKLWDAQTAEYIKTLSNEKPYAGMIITGVSGLTEAQKETLRYLGAVENG